MYNYKTKDYELVVEKVKEIVNSIREQDNRGEFEYYLIALNINTISNVKADTTYEIYTKLFNELDKTYFIMFVDSELSVIEDMTYDGMEFTHFINIGVWDTTNQGCEFEINLLNLREMKKDEQQHAV